MSTNQLAGLKGKNVVVIGGTSGIGLATATAASQLGANVWAVGRSAAHIDKARDQDALKAIFEEVGTIDHLVSAATGASRTLKPFVEQTDEQFQEAFGKLWGYSKVVRCGVPYMAETGSITLVSGAPARKLKANSSVLSCVGAAVENLVRCLAIELAPIRVNVVSPGIIDTALFDGLGDKRDMAVAGMVKGQLIERVGRPEEVAGALIYLMNNGYATGTTVDVDGGQLLR